MLKEMPSFSHFLLGQPFDWRGSSYNRNPPNSLRVKIIGVDSQLVCYIVYPHTPGMLILDLWGGGGWGFHPEFVLYQRSLLQPSQPHSLVRLHENSSMLLASSLSSKYMYMLW